MSNIGMVVETAWRALDIPQQDKIEVRWNEIGYLVLWHRGEFVLEEASTGGGRVDISQAFLAIAEEQGTGFVARWEDSELKITTTLDRWLETHDALGFDRGTSEIDTYTVNGHLILVRRTRAFGERDKPIDIFVQASEAYDVENILQTVEHFVS